MIRIQQIISMDSSPANHDDARRLSDSPQPIYKYKFSSLWTNLQEILEIAGFITPFILHPVQGFRTYFPTMGSSSYALEHGSSNSKKPKKTAIRDLARKVILVTGGMSGFKSSSHAQLNL